MAITFSQLGNQGRCGNALFQIAAVVALALRNNDKYIFPPWQYQNDFGLHGCFTGPIASTELWTEPHFYYEPIQYKPNMDVSGYLQSEKYFADQQDIIRQLLTPKMGFGIRWGYTSIHIRRGDYLHLTKEFAQQDMGYYRAAMEAINSKHYLVFSDDLLWCRANFKGDNITFSDGRSVIEDLALMAACEHQIIANSSFSWWAAWLNANPTKTVIAPKRWFGPVLPHDTKDLLPTEWITI
jgi:hypothetical protein